MNKHFRFSGSNFSRLEELGVRASAVLRRAGLSQGLLGYEDANSFVRAFRTWEGVPPARWREQHRVRVAS